MKNRIIAASAALLILFSAGQVVAGTITVDANNAQCFAAGGSCDIYNENYANINDAIADATAGDTVEVVADSYTETVTVNKSLTVRGANAGINPNTDARGAESILVNKISVTSSDVTIDGFQFNGSNGTVSAMWVQGSHTGNTVRNNIITGTTTSGTRGIEVSASSVANMLIENNFISAWHSGIYLGGPSSDIEVSNNNFTANLVGIGSDHLTAIQINNNDFIDNVYEGWGSSDVGADVEAHCNRFNGNNGVGIAWYNFDEVVGDDINATKNWWADASGPNIDGGGPGTGEALSLHVIIEDVDDSFLTAVDELCSTIPAPTAEPGPGDGGDGTSGCAYNPNGGYDLLLMLLLAVSLFYGRNALIRRPNE